MSASWDENGWETVQGYFEADVNGALYLYENWYLNVPGKNTEGIGVYLRIGVDSPDLKDWNDRASSVFNASNSHITLYEEANYQGRSFRLRPGQHYDRLGLKTSHDISVPGPDAEFDWNDKISSIKFDAPPFKLG